MPNIHTFPVSRLRNDDLRGFFVRLKAIVIACFGLLEEEQAKDFGKALDHYGEALDGITSHKKSLADYDEQCTKAWRLTSHQAKTSMEHFDPAVASAAREVNKILDEEGDPTRMKYDRQNAIILKQLNRIEALDPQILVRARLSDIVVHLRTSYDAFIRAQGDENTRRTNIEKAAAKAARAELVEAWKHYIPVIEWRSKTEPAAIDAVNQINQVIDETKSILNRKKKAGNKDDEGDKGEKKPQDAENDAETLEASIEEGASSTDNI